MIYISAHRLLRTFLAITLVAAGGLAVSTFSHVTRAQKSEQKLAPAGAPAAQLEEPRYREYRGVRLGMTAAEVRHALGTPKESDGRQEFYVFSDTEMVQVFFDTRRNVWAVTVSYMGEQNKAPTAEKIFGGPVEVKPDGSVYKMVKYERAGYFVAYSRDAGDAPFVTVVMQKLTN